MDDRGRGLSCACAPAFVADTLPPPAVAPAMAETFAADDAESEKASAGVAVGASCGSSVGAKEMRQATMPTHASRPPHDS